MLPMIEIQQKATHPAVFVVSWIALSSITILFNKYILSNLGFHFPAILTCWHLAFATLMTQVLARTTTLLDGRKSVKMTGRVYLRAILPIGVLYSASLVCSNQTYLYLSVAFIQMLKASAPVAVLLTSWLFSVSSPALTVFCNILVIVFGVALASFGEIKFVWIGFFYQMGGIVFEAIRLIMIQILLSGEGQNMDPLVSLYYYAPVCAVMNALVALAMEANTFAIHDIWRVGTITLLANASVAFLLNVSSVFLIGKTSGLVMTLCGVLKNILLVIASVILFSTIVTPLQIFGYAIATLGLIYYGVGYEGCMTYYTISKGVAVKLWEGDVDAPRGMMLRRVLLVFCYSTIAILLLLGIGVQMGWVKGWGWAEKWVID